MADLYVVPDYQGQGDYLSDKALDSIESVVIARLPHGGFDLAQCNAVGGSVMAKVKMAGVVDALTATERFEAILQGATVLRTLHANLIAARAALAQMTMDTASE